MFKTDVAKFVFKNKYAKNGEKSWADVVTRVVNHVVQAEETDKDYWFSKFFQVIYNRDFIPGGRILANAGTSIPNLMNCFYLDVEDSRSGIYSTLKNAAEIFAHGGGLGYNFSNLREKGAHIKGTGGKASGPVSFMQLFDTTGEVIEQASRRGAQMGILNIDHPDIVEFINVKSTLSNKSKSFLTTLNSLHKSRNDGENINSKIAREVAEVLRDTQMTHFNLSVGVFDKFMEAVENDEDWELVSPMTGEVKQKVKARGLLKLMAQRAWESGDPGVIFLDRVNKDNIVPYYGELRGSNPCLVGETILKDGARFVRINDIVSDETNFTGGLAIVAHDDMYGNACSKVYEADTFYVWETGRKPVITLISETGRSITLTKDHLLLDSEGNWIEAQHSFYKDIKTIDGYERIVRIIDNNEMKDVYDFKMKNEDRPWNYANGFVCHNCGEIFLFDKEACNLGAINLLQIYSNEFKNIDWEKLEFVVRIAVRFLDDVITVSSAPLEEINRVVKGLRRMGLGVMGWADLLAKMEIPYNSQEAYDLAESISWFITAMAIDESYKLGEERGAFSFYNPEQVDFAFISKIMDRNGVKYNLHRPLRNVSWTAIQPTGSIALLGEVNSAIEPFFALAYKRNISLGESNTIKTVIIMNPILEEKLLEYGLTEEEIEEVRNYILENGTIKDSPHVPEKLQKVFITAKELTPEEHINMQAAWQKYISNSVSKTINMPNSATPEDVENAFKLMWKKRLKGGTIYRDGSKIFQVLN